MLRTPFTKLTGCRVSIQLNAVRRLQPAADIVRELSEGAAQLLRASADERLRAGTRRAKRGSVTGEGAQ